MALFPHYHLVPKDYVKNLKWRKEIIKACGKDPELAAAVRLMCAEDCLFYFNAFLWTYDPRDSAVPNKPFITYAEFQDEAIEEAIDAITEGYDVAWPKSRTMGASWMGLSVFEWFWHFKRNLSFLLMSRNQDYVDLPGNPKSLFWKIDFIHMNQPQWLLPTGRYLGLKDPNRRALHLRNADTNTVIDGESTTGDAGRGDRRTAMFIDEHAAFEVKDGFKVMNASRETSRCRFFNSTPQGANNAFYEVVHNSAARIFRMHWSIHPEYNRGLYTSIKTGKGYKVQVLGKPFEQFYGVVKTRRKSWNSARSFRFPEDYPFILDGKLRSPWYDTECARCVTTQEIAQELDIDFLGSAYQFFDQDFIKTLMKEYCVPYILRGRVTYDTETLNPYSFEMDDQGPLFLWFNLPGDGSVLTDKGCLDGRRFGLGSDVSHGTGASNSVTSIVDLDTGRKVAVWRNPHTDPVAFADETVALAKWFNKGFMVWDASGPSGRSFTNRVMLKNYTNIYYRRSEGRVRERISDQPGFFLNSEDRAVLLREYRIKLQDRIYINPSETGMKETLSFIVEPGGKVVHSASINSIDPTGAREAHGDEVIADALASRLLSLQSSDLPQQTPIAPWMSPAWRMRKEEEEALALSIEDW